MGNLLSSGDEAVADHDMFQRLQALGYEENVTMEAAQKYPTDLMSAIDWLTENGEKSSDNNEDADIDIDEQKQAINDSYEACIGCPSMEKCIALNRIMDGLNVYSKYKKKDKDDDDTKDNDGKNEKLSEFLSSITEHRQHIITDFHHILNRYLNGDVVGINKSNKNFEDIYMKMTEQENMHCNIETCSIYIRNNRQRETQKLCDTDIVYMELWDCIHCYFLHSFDTGHRLRVATSEYESKNDNNNNNNKSIYYDPHLSELNRRLISRREQLRKIRGINRMENNKFMTTEVVSSEQDEKMQHDEEEQEQNETKNETETEHENDNEVNVYSFGEEFDYWSTDGDHKPKYSSIKEEVLSNKIYNVTKNAYNATYMKAKDLLQNSPFIQFNMQCDNDSYYESLFDSYGIKSGTPLNVYNIMSLIFYTDYDSLSYHFSSTFRKLTVNDDAQKRNREYWNWSKILIETVNCWGTKMKHTRIKAFYHGVSNVYFNQFITAFYSPTSTTTQLSVAMNFTHCNGVILELHKGFTDYSDYIRYFDCSFVSNYGNEAERLFIRPPNHQYQLKILTIMNVATNENYKDFIKAIRILEHIFSRDRNEEVSPENAMTVNGIIQFLINSKINDGIPNYIQKSISKWRDAERKEHEALILRNLKEQGLDIWDQNVLRFDVLVQIRKDIKYMECWSAGCIDEEYLNSLLSILKRVNNVTSKLSLIKLKDVWVRCSDDVMMKYKSLFEEENWKMKHIDLGPIHEMTLSTHPYSCECEVCKHIIKWV